MPNNPLTDIWQFVTATTDDYLAIGPWRFLLLALFWLLLISGIVIAVRNWQADPAQRNGRTLGIAFTRILIGCMWFQGSLWKLPLPASEGLRYWTEQEVTRAAFTDHQNLIKDVVLPNLHLLGPIVYLAETTFAISLILGFAVRGVGILSILFVPGRSGGVAVVLHVSRPADVHVRPRCRRPPARARCDVAPKSSRGARWQGSDWAPPASPGLSLMPSLAA